ncbi:proline iminopeptidase [Rhodofomes roseus]|uniref:Proline iminopeptidase n=1 Tax=Rhodofomes roseus TaxID=34475 RepID=A0ABQ8JXE5_9APHY|nr:proline iminopeptidase [Rhodofomes roseus]KAH9828770.1 proline iminopeptidase [Rhodofomes roseus]
MATATVSEGTIPFIHQGETYQTFYKVFGDLKNRTRAPLIGLHGGPGLAHDYLIPLGDLTSSASVPVILYDQIGGGRSTHLPKKSKEFWTIDLFLDELVNLLNHFGIHEEFHLIGHSWGGILATELAVRRQPAGLRSLVLTNSLASYALWMESNIKLLQAFPPWVLEGMAAGYGDKAKLLSSLKEFHLKHGCFLNPQPKEFTGTLEDLFADDDRIVVPATISAPDGELASWTIVDRLHLIRVPTLVINGRMDVAQDFVVRPFFEKIQKVKWRTFESSSHTPMWEEREAFNQEVLAFLDMKFV